MDFSKLLSGGGSPIIMDYQIGDDMSNAGVPVLIGGAGQEGVILASTTAAADLVGVTVDAPGAVVTAQQSDNSDPARYARVCISPDAVYKARLSGGATEGTALTAHTVDTANTAGTSIETDAAFVDETSLFCHSGANAGVGRKITSISGNHATVSVALPNDIAVGDVFITAPYCAAPFGMENHFVQLTTNLYELDCSVTVDTDNNNFRVLELLYKDNSLDPDRLMSAANIVPFDSIFAAGGSV